MTTNEIAAIDEAFFDEVLSPSSRWQGTDWSKCWRIGDWRNNRSVLQVRLCRDSSTMRIGYCRLEFRDGTPLADIATQEQFASLLSGLGITAHNERNSK